MMPLPFLAFHLVNVSPKEVFHFLPCFRLYAVDC